MMNGTCVDGLIDEEPVRVLAVIAEAFSMVTEDCNDGPVDEAPGLEELTTRPTWESVKAISPRYGCPLYFVRNGSGGVYGVCGL